MMQHILQADSFHECVGHKELNLSFCQGSPVPGVVYPLVNYRVWIYNDAPLRDRTTTLGSSHFGQVHDITFPV